MKQLEIMIDEKKYEYLDSITHNDIKYVAYMDDGNIYIKKYDIINDEIIFYDIDDELFNEIKEAMGL